MNMKYAEITPARGVEPLTFGEKSDTSSRLCQGMCIRPLDQVALSSGFIPKRTQRCLDQSAAFSLEKACLMMT